MLDANTIRHLISSGAKSGAKGIVLVLAIVVAQWQTLGEQQQQHETRIQVLERWREDSLRLYHLDRAEWVRGECLDIRAEGRAMPAHLAKDCEQLYRLLNQSQEKTDDDQQTDPEPRPNA